MPPDPARSSGRCPYPRPYRAYLVCGAIAHRDHQVDAWCLGPGELVPRLAAHVGHVEPASSEVLRDQRVDAAARVTSRAERVKAFAADGIERGFRHMPRAALPMPRNSTLHVRALMS